MQARQEISAFTLDYIIHRKMGIGAGTPYVETSAQPWVQAPPEAGIIVWAPPLEKYPDDSLCHYLNTGAPLRVWWLAGTQLTEVAGDKAAAIEDYRQTHMDFSKFESWSYQEYGILALSGGNTKAQVYVGVMCGPLCGEGNIYRLERSRSGKWRIRKSETKWIS